MRCDAQAGEVRAGAALDPDGLPDAAGVGVPVIGLLSEQRVGGADVPGADGEGGGPAGLEIAREIQGEGCVAAVVLRDEAAIHPDLCIPIHRSEAEEWAQPPA